jgi:hypothetical protein
MAQSLERLSLEEAVESGRNAISALDDAQRKAKDSQTPSDYRSGHWQRWDRARAGLGEQNLERLAPLGPALWFARHLERGEQEPKR